jgi:hypothetical protein
MAFFKPTTPEAMFRLLEHRCREPDAVNDYLSRALKRDQVGEHEVAAGRRFQGLHLAVAAGNVKAKKTLEALNLGRHDAVCDRDGFVLKFRSGDSRFALLCDVLCSEAQDARGVASPLAAAAAKRSLNPSTGSRDMKRLGRTLRRSLSILAKEFEKFDAHSTPEAREEERRRKRVFDRLDKDRRNVGLGGVTVSSPATDALDRVLATVRPLARERGFQVVPSSEGDGFDVVAFDGRKTTHVNRQLREIEAALKRTAPLNRAPVLKRKRGARGRAPVTLAKHA